MLNTTTYLPKLKEFEGSIPHMYLDTTANVTVGVGNMLPDADAAKKLAFVRRANAAAKPPVVSGPATDDEIEADFDNVSKQVEGRLAAFYKQFTKLDLPETVSDALLSARVTEFLVGLKASFPEYDLYPEEVCAALFDMAFNLGLGKLKNQFPTFTKAVKARDWTTAAKECRRGGINDDRNNWTKTQFEKAAADKAALDAARKKAQGT